MGQGTLCIDHHSGKVRQPLITHVASLVLPTLLGNSTTVVHVYLTYRLAGTALWYYMHEPLRMLVQMRRIQTDLAAICPDSITEQRYGWQ